jgi:hypothetical protein
VLRERGMRPGLEPADSDEGKAHRPPSGRISSDDDDGGGFAQAFAPHLFQVVEAAHLGLEEMDDDVAGIDQHPIALAQALGAATAIAILFERLQHALGQRHHLALRAPAGDDEMIGDAGFALEVDDGEVFCLAIFEGLLDEREKRGFGRRVDARLGLAAGDGPPR